MNRVRKWFKRFYRVIIALLLLLFFLLVALYFAIQSPRFQNYIATKITEALSKKLNTKVSIGNIKIEFFNNVLMEEFYIEDLNKDTLAYFRSADANFSYFSLLDETISLDDIKIENLKLYLNRTSKDSTFNFNFLLNKKEKKNNLEKSPVWDISLKDFSLINTDFRYEDNYTGSSFITTIPKLNLSVNNLDLDNEIIDIKELNIYKPTIIFSKSKNHNKIKKDFDLDIPFFVYTQKININDAKFSFINNIDTLNYYNLAFNNIEAKKINIAIENTYLFKDSISASIQKFELIEKSGFEIKNLNAIISMNSKAMSLDTLSLKTNKSTINTSAKMTYRSFDDFKDFSRKIQFKANLNNTIINPDDLKYFVNTSKLGIGGVFRINGEIRGKLSSLKAKNIELFAGKRTKFKGTFSLNGLPNIKETFISFKIDKLVTDYKDITFIHNKIPLPINAKKLGKIYFKGRFDGFYSDFVSYGEATTDLGFIKTDINFKISESGIPSYSGKVNIEKFELGKWFDKEKIGSVSLNAKINGKGLKLETLDAKLNGEIEEITFNNYTYKNLLVDGAFKDNFFKGTAKIDDEHLKIDFKGLIDATANVPVFDFTAKLDKLELLPLNFGKKDYKISAELKSNFKANNIDDILGKLELNKLTITHNKKDYRLNKVLLNSSFYGNEKHLDIIADNLKILIHGNYKIRQLPQTVKHIFIGNDNDSTNLETQLLRFDAEITDKTDLISLFIPKLKIPKKIIISGNLNSETQSILAMIRIPKLYFGDIHAEDFISNIKIENGEIDMINSLPYIYLKDSLVVKDISVLAKGFKENIDFSLNASNKNENTYIGLNGKMKFENKLFTFLLNPSSKILINNSHWNIAKGNYFSINKKTLETHNFSIKNNDSQASIRVNKNDGTNNLVLKLENIHIEDFTKIIRNKGIDLYGDLNGEIKISNFDKEPAINGNIDLLNIIVNNYEIGDFKVDSRVDIQDKRVYLKGGLFSKENHININGSYSFDKKSKQDDIDINVFIKQFTVKSFEDFIPHLIHHSSGTINGNVKILGARKEPNIYGYVDVNDVTTIVSYTQTRYTIAKTRVLFKKNLLQLEDGFMLQDDEGNVAYGSGFITHENLKNWTLDLRVITDRIKALNTTIADNDVFYGKAYLNGGATFTGLSTEVLVYIWGESEAESYLDIPLLDDVANKQHEFYHFITKKEILDRNTLEEEENVAIKIRGAKVKLDLNIDEDLELKLILNQEAGDVLRVKGFGDIKIDVGRAAEYVNFFGTYSVTEGDYLFTMKNIVNKPFRIKPGSKILFNGDIYEDAKIEMSATYTRKVALNNFITEYLPDNDNELRSIARTRVPVTLYLDLSEKLSKPTIKFDIGIEYVDPKIRNYVESKLQAIKLNESEMNNQIFGVLVLTDFIPSYTALENSLGSSSSDAIVNTVTELISSQLSRYLTDWASLIVKDLEFYVNFTSYDPTYLSDETHKKRRELQLALSKRFFDDRLNINVGGNFDFGENYAQNNPSQSSNSTFFGGNVSFEYTITQNRRWLIKAFTVSDYDNYNEDNRKTRTGIGLSYRREFDNFYDLFNIKKKKKKN